MTITQGRPALVPHEHFDKNIFPVTECGCWIWMGSLLRQGYGRFSAGRRNQRAHRYAFERFRGPIPDGMGVLHTCDIRCCVNPDHLFVGTNADNMRDKERKRRGIYGERNHATKLTANLVRMVLVSSESNANLGRRLGVHCSTIRRIRIGKTWRAA